MYNGIRYLIYCTSMAIYRLDITNLDQLEDGGGEGEGEGNDDNDNDAVVLYRANNPNANLGSLALDIEHRRLYFRDFSYYATR